MNTEYHQQAQRLQQLRSAGLGRQQGLGNGFNGGGGGAVNGDQDSDGDEEENGNVMAMGSEQLKDPLIFPGVYAPSGFNIMDILVKVHTRPNPTISIGNIDHSVALTLCDSTLPDMPIIYCSEQFELLTGYLSSEIVGRNCRFLQRPPAGQVPREDDVRINDSMKKELREKMSGDEEARVHFVNYTKSGKRFVNILTTIPISGEGGKRYVVGFQVDAKRAFG